MIGKKEMVTQIVERYNNEHEEEGIKLTKIAAAEMFDTVFGTLVDMVKAGVEVAIPNLGRFKIVQRNERVCRNPLEGHEDEEIVVPAHKVPQFKAAKGYRDAVKEL